MIYSGDGDGGGGGRDDVRNTRNDTAPLASARVASFQCCIYKMT